MIGLDYVALYRVAETLGIEVTGVLLHKLKLLEIKVLEKAAPEGEKHG